MNSVNANWSSVRDPRCAFSIGVTKNVQPYCRLAIITMQTTPSTSWTQRSRFKCARAASADGSDTDCSFVVIGVLLGDSVLRSGSGVVIFQSRAEVLREIPPLGYKE